MTVTAERAIVGTLAVCAIAVALWQAAGPGSPAPAALSPEEIPPPPDTTDRPSLAWVGASPRFDEPGDLGPALYTANVVRLRPPMPARPSVVLPVGVPCLVS